METRILLVDDFDTMVKIIKSLLNEIGYTNIVTARNGEQACLILEQGKIDFIISDWNMPRMTGLELLQKVRATPNWAHIPFLMVTAEAEHRHIAEAIESGVDQYIIKPFKQEKLAQKIRLALAKRGL